MKLKDILSYKRDSRNSLQMKRLLLLFLVFLPTILSSQDIGGQYYVALNGDDTNPGTYSQPWGTWQKAFATAQAGDTVYFRGGRWLPLRVFQSTNAAVYHSPSQAPITGFNGTKEKPICFFNYPGETPILDCKKMDMTGRRFNGAISLHGSHFIHIKGLQITNVFQPSSGELASGLGASLCSNLTIENVEVSYVGGRGMSYWGIAGHPEAAHIPYDTTRYINCDVFNCLDLKSKVPGNGSDGWKLDNESAGYLYFYGCRAWNCGDDGFDISGPGVTVLDNCWSFDHNFPDAPDGNGFKFGGNRGDNASIGSNGELILGTPVEGVRKIVKNCIAVNNIGIGLYDLGYKPYYPNNARVYNNSLYKNGIGIQMAINKEYSGQTPSVYRNNIIYGTRQRDAAGKEYNLSVTEIYIESNNTWKFADASIVGSLPWWIPNDELTVTDDDFISLDWSQLSKPRKADGSLPDISFMKLDPSSKLIDAGVDVGLPFYGKNPDLGYAEYNPNEVFEKTPPYSGESEINTFPNPAQNEIWIQTKDPGRYEFKLSSISGQVIMSGQMTIDWEINNYLGLPAVKTGVYILELKKEGKKYQNKLIIQ